MESDASSDKDAVPKELTAAVACPVAGALVATNVLSDYAISHAVAAGINYVCGIGVSGLAAASLPAAASSVASFGTTATGLALAGTAAAPIVAGVAVGAGTIAGAVGGCVYAVKCIKAKIKKNRSTRTKVQSTSYTFTASKANKTSRSASPTAPKAPNTSTSGTNTLPTPAKAPHPPSKPPTATATAAEVLIKTKYINVTAAPEATTVTKVSLMQQNLPNYSSTPTEHVSSSTNSPIGIGIYFDMKSFNISTYEQTSGSSLTELVFTTPEICFTQDKILIGEEANAYCDDFEITAEINGNHKYFNLFNIVACPQPAGASPIIIDTNGSPKSFCVHEIFAAFLQHSLKDIEATRNIKIGNIVFTIPFTPTSASKEVIYEAVKIAGHQNIRILTTTLSTGISFAENSKFYRSEAKKIETRKLLQHVFVLEIKKYSFFLGIIKMTPTCIKIKYPWSSDNIKKCREGIFLKQHKRLFKGKRITPNACEYIRQIYSEAIDFVLEKSRNFSVDTWIVARESTNGTLFEEMIRSLLKGKVTFLNDGMSSLRGASILASCISNSRDSHSKNPNGTSGLPGNLKVCDVSFCDLKITLKTPALVLEEESGFFGKKLVEGCIFHHVFAFEITKFPTNVFAVVQEDFFDEKRVFQAGSYRFTFECSEYLSNSYSSDNEKSTSILSNLILPVELDLFGWIDCNGVFSLTAEFSSETEIPLELSTQRLDVKCSSSHTSE